MQPRGRRIESRLRYTLLTPPLPPPRTALGLISPTSSTSNPGHASVEYRAACSDCQPLRWRGAPAAFKRRIRGERARLPGVPVLSGSSRSRDNCSAAHFQIYPRALCGAQVRAIRSMRLQEGRVHEPIYEYEQQESVDDTQPSRSIESQDRADGASYDWRLVGKSET